MKRSVKERKQLLDMCGARLFLKEKISIKEIMDATGYTRDSVNQVIWQIKHNSCSGATRSYLESKFGSITLPLAKSHMKIGEITDRRKTLLRACYNDGDSLNQIDIATSVGYSHASVSTTMKQIRDGKLSKCDAKYIGGLFVENVFSNLESGEQIFDDDELRAQEKLAAGLVGNFYNALISLYSEEVPSEYLSERYEEALIRSFLEYQKIIASGVNLCEARNLERKSAFEVKTYNVVFNTLNQMMNEGKDFCDTDENSAIEVRPRAFRLSKKET